MLTFLGAALVLIMIPGPDQALVTRNALAGGRPAGMWTMIGGATGLSVHATAAAAGVSALLLASHAAFTVLKVIGVAYLVWMGVQTISAARRHRNGEPATEVERPVGRLRYLRNGFLCNALNPKVALFFVTFLPQFLPRTGAVFGYALLLSALFAVVYLCWFGLYVIVIDRLAGFLSRARVRARIEQITGVLLVGFAVRLALQ
jgi:threonine/homoserine/homoserine lactone efflux protein